MRRCLLHKELPEYAILDSESFPSSVLPYLVEGDGYEITDTVREIGDEILDGIQQMTKIIS
ncbi:MAG: hypothetical protein R2883_04285 [Caldisericia bacterium]